MAFPAKKKDFIGDVVDDMGPDDADKGYGAEMSDAEDPGGDDEESGQDRIMAAKAVARALGVPDADAPKLAEALRAFVSNCD